MPKGKPLSDETKKKISEALKKGGTEISVANKNVIGGKIGEALIKHYGNVVNVLNQQKSELAALNSFSTKGMSKEDKAKHKGKKDAIRKVIAAQKEEIKRIREKAKALKKVERANQNMAKAQRRLEKVKTMRSKVKDRIAEVDAKYQKNDKKDPEAHAERMARMQEQMARIDEIERETMGKIEEYKRTIKAKGKQAESSSNPLGLSEIWLTEKKYDPYRELTLVEKKTNFRVLNENFNVTEKELEDSLIETINADLEKALKSAEKKLEAKDVAGLIALTFIFSAKIRKQIVDIIKKSFEIGKKTASEEIDVERPITPTLNTQLMNMEADQIADEFSATIEREAKEIARNGLLKGLGIAAIIAAMTNRAKDKAAQMTTNLIGSVVGENINKGRRYVFEKNSFKIKAYQRSEVLDSKTCSMCMSLDKRIVRADDPMSKMDLVHTHCRGIWVPITQDETVEGSYGLPKTVLDAFDTVGGVPSINSFTQLKKPINKSNESVQAEIKRRIK